ncbi:uncharacterized protein JN550_005530 [Neoarthrinium moseri]|uniref:uncharacterized protein n=1 Tax=Neoarthrinium moseri TaxID=1658444 RepID=UPI001FDD4E26|nr:uncharacterized protein JN550_005530 [Neoarthrinium moseri]KAI1869940.1 hypothetical protein JN550_005530 [Neoarthrinium moseri]
MASSNKVATACEAAGANKDNTETTGKQHESVASSASFRFHDLPAEIRLVIWRIALSMEAVNRLVLLDTRSLGLMPSAQLVSVFLLVSSESRGEAKEFYNTQLDVHCCTRDMRGNATYGDVKGMLYLNFETDSLLAGANPLGRDYWERHSWYAQPRPRPVYTPPPEQSRYPHNVPRSYLTTRLSDKHCGLVRRMHEVTPSLSIKVHWEPVYCWDRGYQRLGAAARVIRTRCHYEKYPNVWMSRLVVTTRGYNLNMLIDDYASLTAGQLNDKISHRLITCGRGPVLPIEGDSTEFRPGPYGKM